jgi:hypothetical protein
MTQPSVAVRQVAGALGSVAAARARNLRSTSNRNARTVFGSSIAVACRPGLNESIAAETSGTNWPAVGRIRFAPSTFACQRRSREKVKARQAVENGVVQKVPVLGGRSALLTLIN